MPSAKGKYGGRKVREGTVVSDKMQKTVLVAVEEHVKHRLYKKRVKRVHKFMAHDETETARLGDKVRIVESRPVSKNKRWALVEVLQRIELPEIAAESIDLDLLGEVKPDVTEAEETAVAAAPEPEAVAAEAPAVEAEPEPEAAEPEEVTVEEVPAVEPEPAPVAEEEAPAASEPAPEEPAAVIEPEVAPEPAAEVEPVADVAEAEVAEPPEAAENAEAAEEEAK